MKYLFNKKKVTNCNNFIITKHCKCKKLTMMRRSIVNKQVCTSQQQRKKYTGFDMYQSHGLIRRKATLKEHRQLASTYGPAV